MRSCGGGGSGGGYMFILYDRVVTVFTIQAVAQGSVKCQFAGVALGDSWISPLGR